MMMMKSQVLRHVLIVALLSCGSVVVIGGCSAVKKMSPSEPNNGTDATPKKEYNWKDMSAGKSFNRPINAPGSSSTD